MMYDLYTAGSRVRSAQTGLSLGKKATESTKHNPSARLDKDHVTSRKTALLYNDNLIVIFKYMYMVLGAV